MIGIVLLNHEIGTFFPMVRGVLESLVIGTLEDTLKGSLSLGKGGHLLLEMRGVIRKPIFRAFQKLRK